MMPGQSALASAKTADSSGKWLDACNRHLLIPRAPRISLVPPEWVNCTHVVPSPHPSHVIPSPQIPEVQIQGDFLKERPS